MNFCKKIIVIVFINFALPFSLLSNKELVAIDNLLDWVDENEEENPRVILDTLNYALKITKRINDKKSKQRC